MLCSTGILFGTRSVYTFATDVTLDLNDYSFRIANGTGTQMARFSSTGSVGNVEIDGNVYFTGKIYYAGGIDPLYLQFDPAHASEVPIVPGGGSIYVSDGTDGMVAGNLIFKKDDDSLVDLVPTSLSARIAALEAAVRALQH